jgi:hypothetical protein
MNDCIQCVRRSYTEVCVHHNKCIITFLLKKYFIESRVDKGIACCHSIVIL